MKDKETAARIEAAEIEDLARVELGYALEAILRSSAVLAAAVTGGESWRAEPAGRGGDLRVVVTNLHNAAEAIERVLQAEGARAHFTRDGGR